jgi:uncharacterized protein (TIGR03083 family)
MAAGWDLVAQERRSFADLIEPLTAEQADTPSMCGWTVHQTAAHLLTFTHYGIPKLMLQTARSGFNYDKAADRIARKLAAEHPLPEVAAMLRDRADKSNPSKSFPPEMTLTDVTVHRQDIRRALTLGTDVDGDLVDTVLTWMTTHKQAKAVVTPGRIDGLALASTDTDWSFGTGESVEGPGEALMMALAGRDTLDELSGDGVATLRDRD